VIEKTFKPYTKADILASLQKLPEDATIDDAMESLYILGKLEAGLAASEADDVVSQDDIEREMSEWPE